MLKQPALPKNFFSLTLGISNSFIEAGSSLFRQLATEIFSFFFLYASIIEASMNQKDYKTVLLASFRTMYLLKFGCIWNTAALLSHKSYYMFSMIY